MAAIIADEDDFYSSELEADPRPKLFASAGLSTIQQMQLNRAQDRVTSKKLWKNLSLTPGSLSSQYALAVWTNAWEDYWNSLKKRDDTMPNAEHIVRFLSTVMQRVTPRYKDKYGNRPSARTIGNGFMWLHKYLADKYEAWKVTEHLQTKVKSFINQAINDGRLFRGRKMERRWVGFTMCQVILQEYIGFALRHGCFSWDVIISQTLSVALMVSLDCRAGDFLRATRTAQHQVMTFSAIRLYLEGGKAVDNLLAHCTIKFEKGKKDSVNEDRVRLLSPLHTSTYNCVDPILLLLVHGLRNGLFLHGTDLPSVLAKAYKRQDKTIEWKHPDLPVIPQIKYGKLVWQKPATQNYLYQTVRKMGLCAGILQPIKPHDFRRGCIRDLSRIPKGVFTNVHAAAGKASGHAKGSVDNDTTSMYAGNEMSLLNRHKVSLPAVKSDNIGYTYAPSFPKKAKKSTKEIDAALQEEAAQGLRRGAGEPQSQKDIKSDRRRMGSVLRKNELKTWRTQDAPTERPVLLPATPAATVSNPRKRKSLNDSTKLIDGADEAELFMSSEVSESEHDSLMENLFATTEDDDIDLSTTTDEDSDEGTLVDVTVAMTLDAVGCEATSIGHKSPLLGTATEFVLHFASFNVVKNSAVSGGWIPTDEQWKVHVDMGNARNAPTRFQYLCQNVEAGCKQVCYTEVDKKTHEQKCNFDPSRIEDHLSEKRQAERARIAPKKEEYKQTARAKHTCNYEGCLWNATSADNLEVHRITHYCAGHTKCPKQADCGDSSDFRPKDLLDHYEGHHSSFAIEPRTCPGTLCPRLEPFTSKRKLAQHLRDRHGFRGAGLKQIMA